MSSTFHVEPFSTKHYELGEGPHWHPKSKKLFFVDIPEGLVLTLDNEKKEEILLKEQEPVSSVLPVDGEPNKMVVSVGTAVYSVDSTTGKKVLLDKLLRDDIRFNDAKCDPRGRLWIGTMGLEVSPAVVKAEQGSLYMLNSDGKLLEKMDKVTLSNGISWSNDHKSIYYIDSVKRVVYVLDYDIETGNIVNRRILVDMNKDDEFNSKELPDGMTIDINGNLWVAIFRGSRIVNIDAKTGKVIQSIRFPTSLITSCCFGGTNLDEMYVTSSYKFLDNELKVKEPLAGYVFKVTSDDKNFRGREANFDFCQN